jgi:hypothetical protein
MKVVALRKKISNTPALREEWTVEVGFEGLRALTVRNNLL